jgi:uncharacterized membrane protein YdbT with pleckstrin-like domain
MSSDDSVAGKRVAPELVASMLPPAMLQQDEIVLLLVKPSLWFIVLTSVRFILVTLLLTYLAGKLVQAGATSYVNWQTVVSLGAMVCTGRLIWALLVWTSHIYLLTNQRVVTIKGVVNVTIFQTNLRRIQRTELYRPLVERILSLGTIGFATAATTSFDSSWVMISRPMQTHEQIVAAISKVQGNGGV